MKETLQEKIKEVLPKRMRTEVNETHLMYNKCLSDVHSSIPKVLEVIMGEILDHKNIYRGVGVVGNNQDKRRRGYNQAIDDIINLLK